MSKPRGIRPQLSRPLPSLHSFFPHLQSIAFATGVPDCTSVPPLHAGSAEDFDFTPRQYQLFRAKVRLAALLGHGSELSIGQCAPAVRCCPHTGSAPQRGSY
jgi:hypothetical protein